MQQQQLLQSQQNLTNLRLKEHLFKVLVIGDASTGKTSFIKRYVHQFFSRAYKATIGVDFALKNILVDDKTLVRLQLWDIAGQDRFASMTRPYYKDAFGAFIVFDASNPLTFESVSKWKQDLDNKVSLSDESNVPCLLLANKCDLVDINSDDERELSEFAEANGFIGYCYTSPKNNINIESSVLMLVEKVLEKARNLDDDDYDDICDDTNNRNGNNKTRQARRREQKTGKIQLSGTSFLQFNEKLHKTCCSSS